MKLDFKLLFIGLPLCSYKNAVHCASKHPGEGQKSVDSTTYNLYCKGILSERITAPFLPVVSVLVDHPGKNTKCCIRGRQCMNHSLELKVRGCASSPCQSLCYDHPISHTQVDLQGGETNSPLLLTFLNK